MVLHIVRALFVLLMAAVGWSYIKDPNTQIGPYTWLTMAVAVALAVLFVCIDILAPRKKLAVFAGTFFGLVVGISIAYALSFVTPLLIDQYEFMTDTPLAPKVREPIEYYINLLIGVITCYLSISFILQTKDDFRFIIPYVEFSKQTKGARPIVLDTSVLIDGRISDVAQTGIIESQLIVPRFVIQELQAIADSADKLKRNRGRRGLDTLAELKANERIELIDYDPTGRHDSSMPVDEQLLFVAKDLNARVLTNDLNLNKVARLRGVDVINLNDLANALKPVVLPGERMTVRLVKPGEEPGQGVGYLDDGTMVVVEQARHRLNEEVEFTVTNTRQTSAGKMIFGRLNDGQAVTPAAGGAATAASPPGPRGGMPAQPRRPRSSPESSSQAR
ncbi:MAG TPA: PIN domain-containing protein [Tepidisphaeraceae bacterium]|nr:PIN domain-containing protein [Tepidisphaeraceae bacterium]